VTLAELESSPDNFQLVDPVRAIAHLPQIRTPPEWVSAVSDGKRLEWQEFSSSEQPSEPFALLTPDGESLLAIVVVEEEKLRYRRVFNYGLTRVARSFNVPAEIV
jgi:tRNA U55 pseudouridine synthase TruB